MLIIFFSNIKLRDSNINIYVLFYCTFRFVYFTENETLLTHARCRFLCRCYCRWVKSVASWKHKYTLDATNLSFVFPPVVNNNSSTDNACCNQTTKREIQRFHFGVSCARYKTKNKRLCTVTAKISRIKYWLKSFQRRYWDIVLLPKANFSPASFLASSLREISSMTRQCLRWFFDLYCARA